MKFQIASFIFILIAALSACDSAMINHKSDLYGIWKLSDVRAVEGKTLSFEEEAKLKDQVSKGQLISLFGDNSFTELSGEGKYVSGKWDFVTSPDELILKDKSKEVLSGFVRMQVDKSKTTYLTIQGRNKNYQFVYKKEAGARKQVSDEAYHASNNEWRIRSAKPESEKELKKKLCNYIKHLALILRASSEDKSEVISFAYSTGPILLYRGGIGVYEYDIVPESWKNVFSTEKKAREAYGIYRNSIKENDYKGASSGDWVLDDSNILMSVYSDLSK